MSQQPSLAKVGNPKAVFFFDVDNTLYSKSLGIDEIMRKYIREYIINSLHLDDESAEMLHEHYYKDYGLAIEGLVRFNHVDAMDYNENVDNKLPLEQILHINPELRAALARFDKSKVRLWLFTNAYRTHAERVVKLLGVEDMFEGITFCDYRKRPLICKPMREMFEKAMSEAGVSDPNLCYYVDDSELNIVHAKEIGWNKSIHLVEVNEPKGTNEKGDGVIRSLVDLPDLVPELCLPQ